MLTEKQIEQYHGMGYTVAPALLSRQDIEVLLAEMERVCAGQTLAAHEKTRVEMEPAQPPDGTLVRRIYEPCTYYAPFRQLSESENLLACVEQLLGPDLDFHYSKVNMKPAAIGSVVEWHQDLAYYPMTNPSSVSILMYLDDASRENGCLQVIPRRHLGPPMDHTQDGYFQGRITEPVDESAAVPVEGLAGTTVFMHCLTPHASVMNTSTRPRRTLILSYRACHTFPIYAGEVTFAAEKHVRHVRGQHSNVARYGFQEFPVPKHRQYAASLYELQELSRRQMKRNARA